MAPSGVPGPTGPFFLRSHGAEKSAPSGSAQTSRPLAYPTQTTSTSINFMRAPVAGLIATTGPLGGERQ